MRKIILLLLFLGFIGCENEDNKNYFYRCEKFILKEDYILTPYPPLPGEKVDTIWLDSTWVSKGYVEYVELPIECDTVKYECIKVY